MQALPLGKTIMETPPENCSEHEKPVEEQPVANYPAEGPEYTESNFTRQTEFHDFFSTGRAPEVLERQPPSDPISTNSPTHHEPAQVSEGLSEEHAEEDVYAEDFEVEEEDTQGLKTEGQAQPEETSLAELEEEQRALIEKKLQLTSQLSQISEAPVESRELAALQKEFCKVKHRLELASTTRYTQSLQVEVDSKQELIRNLEKELKQKQGKQRTRGVSLVKLLSDHEMLEHTRHLNELMNEESHMKTLIKNSLEKQTSRNERIQVLAQRTLELEEICQELLAQVPLSARRATVPAIRSTQKTLEETQKQIEASIAKLKVTMRSQESAHKNLLKEEKTAKHNLTAKNQELLQLTQELEALGKLPRSQSPDKSAGPKSRIADLESPRKFNYKQVLESPAEQKTLVTQASAPSFKSSKPNLVALISESVIKPELPSPTVQTKQQPSKPNLVSMLKTELSKPESTSHETPMQASAGFLQVSDQELPDSAMRTH